jgi:ribose transport system ATP-binding protein
MTAKEERLLSLNHISKSFAGTRALLDVSFDLYSGEIHCLVGENGAGKSTLIKILAGAERPDRGEIVLFDRTYAYLEPSKAIEKGIATIYQDADLVNTLSVADNIFLNSEITRVFGFVDAAKQRDLAQEIITQLHINLDAGALVETLSPAQKQTLQIVRALHKKARIIIMDEPTSSLGQEEAALLMTLAQDLAAKGCGIIYISHYLDEVFKIGDRITVLKDGRKIGTHGKERCTTDQIVRQMVGREASLFYKKEKVLMGDVALTVRNYRRGNVVKDVSFDVRRGEIFGIGGMVGSGRTELVNLLFGVAEREAGELLLNGVSITPKTPREAIERGLCLIVEDRQRDGLFMIRSVKENIAIVRNERQGLSGETRAVGHMISKLRLSLRSMAQEVGSLSGGNQQKSMLARWLLGDAAIFIFDEPTKGVDIGAKEEIYKFMTELARQGKGIIMISSDMPELLSMSDRIGVMRDGEMVTVVGAASATEEGLLKNFLGLDSDRLDSHRQGTQ